MRVELVEPFASAAFSVLEMLVQDQPERGALSMRANTFTTQQITIVAGISGEVEGMALYGMSGETAQKIASAMTGEEDEEMSDMAWSAISELGNMITGSATTLLYNAGYKCDITPPSVLRGTGVQVSTRVPAIVVPVETRFGMIEINVALAERYGAKAA